ALIAKLETGMTDRLEALLTTRVDATTGHQLLANVWTGGVATPPALASPQRAQVIANIDYIKAEVPDVFYVALSGDPDYDANYPINFAGAAFLGNAGTTTSYVLPYDVINASANPPRAAPTGFFGASITARAALYKNVNPGGNNALTAQAYDMVDNNGNGF